MECAQAQPPKKRRRRRWFLAALLLASLISWWHWPRGNQNLVGEWRIEFPNWNTHNDNRTPVRELTLTLRRNGTGSLQHRGAKSSDRFRWQFDGQTLVLGEESPTRYASRNLQAAAWAYEKLTGNRWMLAPFILKLKDQDARAVSFDRASSRTPWTMDRRPIVPFRMSRLPE